PSARARARPSLVRCKIRSRSNSAIPDSTVNIRRPCAVVVSAQIAKRLEAGAFPADQVDDPKQVDRRARQPVKLGHDQAVTSLKLIERALQFRPPGGNAGHLLAEYPLNACGQEQRLLRRQRLPGRGDAGVSVDCHFAQDIRTKVMPDITTSAIWCATCKFYNRSREV